MTPHSLYNVTATRNGQTVKLNFVDAEMASDTARELRRRGYDAHVDTHGYRVECEVKSALQTAHLATMRRGEPLEAAA